MLSTWKTLSLSSSTCSSKKWKHTWEKYVDRPIEGQWTLIYFIFNLQPQEV